MTLILSATFGEHQGNQAVSLGLAIVDVPGVAVRVPVVRLGSRENGCSTSTHVIRCAQIVRELFGSQSKTAIPIGICIASPSEIVQVGFNRRFDANFARVRAAVTSGEIGTPHLMHIVSRDPGPPPISYIKVSGGIFLDMTIHDFDMARFLMGDEVEQIYTAAGVRVDPAIGEGGIWIRRSS